MNQLLNERFEAPVQLYPEIRDVALYVTGAPSVLVHNLLWVYPKLKSPLILLSHNGIEIKDSLLSCLWCENRVSKKRVMILR